MSLWEWMDAIGYHWRSKLIFKMLWMDGRELLTKKKIETKRKQSYIIKDIDIHEIILKLETK